MSMKESFISVFKNWRNFSGRACRSEYWFFVLSVFLIAFVLVFVETLLGVFNEEIGYGPVSFLFQIITIIPSISVTSRRMQDRGISGWWQLSYVLLIPIFVIFIYLMLPAQDDENKWGRNPLLEA